MGQVILLIIATLFFCAWVLLAPSRPAQYRITAQCKDKTVQFTVTVEKI